MRPSFPPTPIRSLLAAGLLVALGAAPAHAQIVHDGGAPDGGAGLDLPFFTVADDFELGASAAFDLVRFWGLSSDPLTPAGVDVFWSVFLDDGSGAPGVLQAEGTASATGSERADVGFGFSSYELAFGVGAQSLGAGVYWLALHAPFALDLVWETSTGGRGDGFVYHDGFAWGSFEGAGDLAFQLEQSNPVAAVPEPAPALLLVTGLVGLAAIRRRRRAGGDRPPGAVATT